MSVTMMDNGGPSTPVDVRTECEELREQLARARAASLHLLGWLATWEYLFSAPPVYAVEKVFSITEEELAAEYQRQYDEWVRESSDGQ